MAKHPFIFKTDDNGVAIEVLGTSHTLSPPNRCGTSIWYDGPRCFPLWINIGGERASNWPYIRDRYDPNMRTKEQQAQGDWGWYTRVENSFIHIANPQPGQRLYRPISRELPQDKYWCQAWDKRTKLSRQNHVRTTHTLGLTLLGPKVNGNPYDVSEPTFKELGYTQDVNVVQQLLDLDYSRLLEWFVSQPTFYGVAFTAGSRLQYVVTRRDLGLSWPAVAEEVPAVPEPTPITEPTSTFTVTYTSSPRPSSSFFRTNTSMLRPTATFSGNPSNTFGQLNTDSSSVGAAFTTSLSTT